MMTILFATLLAGLPEVVIADERREGERGTDVASVLLKRYTAIQPGADVAAMEREIGAALRGSTTIR